MYESLKTNIKEMLFSTLTCLRIKRDAERLVKNEVICFVQVLDFLSVVDDKAILVANCCISFNVPCFYGGVIT